MRLNSQVIISLALHENAGIVGGQEYQLVGFKRNPPKPAPIRGRFGSKLVRLGAGSDFDRV